MINKNDTEEVNIILNESNHAKDFNAENLIHYYEFDETIKLIQGLVPESLNTDGKRYLHNTITIFGTRGSGKTSFLLSVKKYYEKSDEIQVLNIIDPTLIEEKGHVFLNVISVISELVTLKLDQEECSSNDQKQYRRKEWRTKMMHLAAGLPSIEGIGSYNHDGWQDPEYVMDSGLLSVTAALNLAKNFDNFLKISLEILSKKAFLLIFDDIDVDATKGWAVLETIRKYFTSSRLITLLSGDLKLYSTVIRQKKWSNFGAEILKYEGEKLKRLPIFNNLVTELESQYLQKIMQPKFRIHLLSLLEKKRIKKSLAVFISDSDDRKKINIEDLYKSIFEFFGIFNKSQLEVYLTFILSQPLRSQIQFITVLVKHLDNNSKVRQNSENITDIFLADLLEKDIDVNLANNTSKYLIIIILNLLLKEHKLKDLYQLQPSTTNNSMNASLLSLNLLLSKCIQEDNIFLVFEYQIKIGYLRNILNIVSYQNKEDTLNLGASIEDLCQKTGVLNDGVLRDITGNINSYIYGYLESINQLQDTTVSFIQLLGLNGPAKRKDKNKLDYVFPNNNSATSVLGHLPSFSGNYTNKNQSRVNYSIYMLIATIGEILKLYETTLINEKDEIVIKEIESALIELSQHRSYSIPNFNTNDFFYSRDQDRLDELKDEAEFDDKNKIEKKDSLENLAKLIFEWMVSAKNLIKVTPHLLGKISTRFFYALNNIIEGLPKNMLLGDLFHYQIVALMNSFLIEDVRENLSSSSFLNISNTNFSDKILFHNINKTNEATKNEGERLKLSKWMLSCPLFLAYLKKDGDSKLTENLKSYCSNHFPTNFFLNHSISEMLNNVAIRGNEVSSQMINNNETHFKNSILGKNGNEGLLINSFLTNKFDLDALKLNSDVSVMRKRNSYIKKTLPGLFPDNKYYSTNMRNLRKRLSQMNLIDYNA